MKTTFSNKAFAKAIRTKRMVELQKNLRPCAVEIGISAATLSRCERESMPDLLTYIRICEWLDANLYDFINERKRK